MQKLDGGMNRLRDQERKEGRSAFLFILPKPSEI